MFLPKYWSLEMEDEPENLAILISLSWEEEGRRGEGGREGGREGGKKEGIENSRRSQYTEKSLPISLGPHIIMLQHSEILITL